MNSSLTDDDERRLRAAFWAVFCGAGELWFPTAEQRGQAEADAAVEPYWLEFIRELRAARPTGG